MIFTMYANKGFFFKGYHVRLEKYFLMNNQHSTYMGLMSFVF